jgi:peptidoglycan-associated lipoprotein
MIKHLLILFAAIGLLAACETVSSDRSRSGGAQLTGEAAELAQVGDTVYFEYDSSALSDDAKATLSAQAAFLAANPTLTVTVEGHCDERGTREYNLALGDRRASAARDYLVAQGVDSARIKTISFGKEKPAFVGSNSYTYSKNRRAASVLN